MRILTFLLILPFLLVGQQNTHLPSGDLTGPYQPFFTGTGLSPTATNVELGHPGLMPVFTVFYNYGDYKNNWDLDTREPVWNFNTLLDVQLATTERTGVEIVASFSARHRGSQKSTKFTDTLLFLGFQVTDDTPGTWIPDFRLSFETILPTGNFRELRPEKFGIDETGQGAYFFGPNFAFQKLLQLSNHFLVVHWSFAYLIPTRARLKDTTAYGGSAGTRGTIRPGNLLSAFLSFEYSLTQNWALAWDNFVLYQGRARGFKGTTDTPIFEPESTQMSIAPALEYSFSERTGIIAGFWLTVAGRNADAFASAFFSIVHDF